MDFVFWAAKTLLFGDDAAGPSTPLQQYEMLRTLGTGTFGRVRLVRHRKEGKYYALKISKVETVIRLKQVEHVKNEVTLLSRIDHPGVVNLVSFFHDDARLYLVLDYVSGGELFSHLRAAVRFPDHQSKVYAAEIVLTFTYLHSLNIIYRDLKVRRVNLSAHACRHAMHIAGQHTCSCCTFAVGVSVRAPHCVCPLVTATLPRSPRTCY
jgi:serine/threonine protein kinase